MSRVFTAAMLKSLGTSLPQLGSTIDEALMRKIAMARQSQQDKIAEEDRQRQIQKDNLGMDATRFDMSQQQAAADRTSAANQALSDFVETESQAQRWQDQGIKPLPGSRTEAMANKTSLDRVAATPIPQYRDVESVDKFMSGMEGERDLNLRLDAAKAKYTASGEKKIFDPETEKLEYEIASQVATGKMPPSMAMQLYTGLGKETANRPRLVGTVNALNPGFDWSKAEIDYKARTSGAASFAGGMGGFKGKAAGEEDVGGINPVIDDRTNQLRAEFIQLPAIKSAEALFPNFEKANDAYDQYKAGNASPYEVDQSLGYFASKALDSNSVVMPGEFDRFAKGLGYQKAQAMVEALINGGLQLTDDQRDAMLNIVNRSMDSARKQAIQKRDYYANVLAKKKKVDPEDVVGGIGYIFEGYSPQVSNSQPAAKQPSSGSSSPTSASKYLDEIRARRKALGK